MRFIIIRCHSTGLYQKFTITRRSVVTVFCLLIPMLSVTDYLWAADKKPLDTVSSSETPESPSMTDLSDHGPVALDGKRLFFAVEERRSDAISSVPVAAATSSLPDKPAALKGLEVIPVAASSSSGSSRSRPASIQYTAWLKGSLSIRVIINGVPCQPVERRVLEESHHGLGLTCSSLEAALMNLNIEKDGRTLTLSRGTSRLGNLHPGDTW